MASFPPSPAVLQPGAPQPWGQMPAPVTPPLTTYTPDYGPFGAPPSVPGVVYFGEKWTARKGATIMMVIGIAMTVLGLLMVLAQAFHGGFPFLVVGVSLWLIGRKGRKSDVHMDVLCDAYGVTMRRNSRAQGDFPPLRVPWAAVSATRCVVTVTQDRSSETGVARNTYTQEFAVDMAGAQAMQMSAARSVRWALSSISATGRRNISATGGYRRKKQKACPSSNSP